MRPHRLAAAGLLLVVTLSACGPAGGAGWTYAPAPSPTPVASAGPSGSPNASGSPTASGSPAASGSPGASGSPAASGAAGTTVTVVATTPLRFDTPTLEAPANQPFTLEFDNQDPTVPHNVVINNPDGSKVSMGDTAPFTGPEKRTYQVPALAAADYPFLCEVHPQAMTGTLAVN